MYRRIPANGVGALKPLHKAFTKFHPWRPKGECFITSGYYFDMDGGGDELKPNQIMLHNLPSGISEADIRKEFPTATKVKINSDGTAIVDFHDGPAAEKAYHDTKMVKMGNRHVCWTNPDEVYLVGVPENVTADDLENDYPGNKGIRFIDEPGCKRVAVIKYPNPKAADDGFEEAPYKKIGKRQNSYDIEENPLHLSNLPPGIKEEDIKKRFPGAKDIKIDHNNGTAKVKFDSDADAHKAYDDSDMVKLGRPKLFWLKPEELAVEGVPKKLTADELKKKDFPNAKKIRFINGEGGKRIAVVEFPSEADQKKAYDGSRHKKIGPQRLGWNGGGVKPDKNAQLKIQGIPKGVTEADLKKKFPTATNITMKSGGRAEIQFGTPADADKAYDDSDMAKLGNKNLAYLGPNQLAVQDVPKKNDKAIKNDLPNLKKIHWLKGPGKTKVAIVDFADPSERQKGYDNSNFNKLGPQTLGFVAGGDDIDNMDDMDLAKKLWKLKGADFSNISNLFSASIMLIGVPQDTKGMDMIKLFEDCKKCDFEGSGSKRTAILEFDKPTSAARAYGKAMKTKIGGKDVKVKVVPIGGFKKKGSKASKSSKKSAKSKKSVKG
jgi:RNA recognition motif-containing protein